MVVRYCPHNCLRALLRVLYHMPHLSRVCTYAHLRHRLVQVCMECAATMQLMRRCEAGGSATSRFLVFDQALNGRQCFLSDQLPCKNCPARVLGILRQDWYGADVGLDDDVSELQLM